MSKLPNIKDINSDLDAKTRGAEIMAEIDALIEREEVKRKAKQKKRIPTTQSPVCQTLNEAIYQNGLAKFIKAGIANHAYTKQGKAIPDKQIKAIKDQALRVVTKPKHHENSAGHVEKCIIAYCSMMPNGTAWKVGGKGTPREVKGKTIMTASGDTNGIADVNCIIRGLFLGVEVKFSKGDKQRKAQKRWQDNVERAGGSYVIVRNFTHFLQVFKNWYADNKNRMI